ncbi:MAG TPA: hypothetical protein VEB42_00725 [Chitinophagaceae bacterium]|nr:hypothetical protein [Chitinophagaceae bacterium]
MADSRDHNNTENREDRLYRQDEPARTSRNSDLTDPQRDQERLRPDEGTIDMPEVRDIPGQENVHVPAMGELADTTISSDDEEGAGVLDELNDEEEDEDNLIQMGTEADITAKDREMLKRGDDYMPTRDEDRLNQASMDNTDFEGEALNEAAFGPERTGGDLDTSGVDEDDAMEDIGEEDEENNQWSLGSGDNDRLNEGTP